MAQTSLKRYTAGGLLGLHFTPEELFFGHAQRRGRAYYVDVLDSVDIRAHTLEGGDFNQLTLAPVIQDQLRKHRVRTRNTVISFPVKFPWIRVIDVPNLPQREMSRIVRLEVERLFLDSTVEKLIDYFPLDEQRNAADGGTTAVLSCAIPRNSVVPYIDLLAAVKLDVVGIDLVELNVLRLAALQAGDFGDGISLLLSFNMQSTDLLLLEDNRLQLVRKVGQGKQQLRDLLYRKLPADSPCRREMGRVDFSLPEAHLGLALDYVAALLGEIRRSIEFYLQDIKHSGGNVTKVILAGSGYWPANLPSILEQQLHLPLIDLRFDKLPDIVNQVEFGPEFPACGVYAPVLGSILKGVA